MWYTARRAELPAGARLRTADLAWRNERRVYLHLDLTTADRDAARAEAIRLGARVAEHQPGRRTVEVLLDPAGHPFCFAGMPAGWPPPFEQSTED